MNRDLLEALGCLAADVYFDAIKRHPGLFWITGETEQTAEDRAMLPVLVCIDELFMALDHALNPRDRVSPHVAPRALEFVDTLPLTATGKIMRRVLRERG